MKPKRPSSQGQLPNHPSPPRWADHLLAWFVAPHLLEYLQGDLHEAFHQRVAQVGLARARRAYVWAILHCLTPFFFKRTATVWLRHSIGRYSAYSTPTNITMIRNYVKTAWRILMKNKAFSIINISGLALSMAICLLLIMIIKDANEYDLFHPDSDRVYRINTDALRKNGGSEPYATCPYPVGSQLGATFTGIEASTVLNSPLQADITAKDRTFSFGLKFTNATFFDLFGFTLQAGNASTALTEPFSIVLTHTLSEKLFPGNNPVGKLITVNKAGTFKVTGVLHEFPGKTHLQFDALGSLATVPTLEKNNLVSPSTTNWQNYYTNYTYIRLKPGVDPENAQVLLTHIAESNYKNLTLETRDAGYRFFLQPLDEITPGPSLSNNMGRGMPLPVLWFLGTLAFIIMLSAAFNYTNLTIAKAMNRTKEFAMRKIVGSSRQQVFAQVIVESILTSLLALVVAFGGLQLLIPQFTKIGFISSSGIQLTTDLPVFLLFVGFSILVGVVAGLLPAVVLSGVKPLVLLQKLQSIKFFRYLGLRKTFLVIQFMISLIFISLVTVAYRQSEYGMAINFGHKESTIFNVPLQGVAYEKAVYEFGQIPGVEKISAISALMGTYADRNEDVRLERDKDPVPVREYFTDENYIDNFNLTLMAGKNFPANHAQQSERFGIVNQKFVEQFKLGSSSEAIGKTIIVGDSTMLTIRGVLTDFLFKPQDYALAPVLLRYRPANWSILNLRLRPGNSQPTVAQLEATWKKLAPYHPFGGRFYQEEIEIVFATMRDIIWIVAFSGFLGVTIACLGLLGITLFTMQSKTKEISVRKVIGATPASLLRLLTKSYVQVMTIALLLAMPIAILLGNILLQSISQRIPLSADLFVPSILIVFLLSLLTIGLQTLKAAFRNPVEGLRNE